MREPNVQVEETLREQKNRVSRSQWLRRLLLLNALATIVVAPGCGASDDGFLQDDEYVAQTEDELVAGTNLALNKLTMSSSTALGRVSGRAVDGNTNGLETGNSMAQTAQDIRPWVEVDLQASQFVGTVVLWSRTDCCSDQLSNFRLRVSDDKVTWQDFQFAGAVIRQATFAINRSARYVRVELNGDAPRTLTLAEMQVFGPPNLAQGKPTEQSSDGWGGVSSRAVDGNTNGSYGGGSVTHTNVQAQPWWTVDLGAPHNVGVVELYNRTDCCADRLRNFKLLVSNDNVNWTSFDYPGQAPTVLPFTVNRSARYVKVQLNGTEALSLAEVRVYPMSNAAMVNTGAGSVPLVQQPTIPVGELKGDFTVDAQGAATYSIPIEVPPGIRDVAPRLSLAYRSGGGNGMLGVGWSLAGLPSITRCARTMATDGVRGSVNGDANDRFCLDGQRLIAISGAYGASGTEYRTELNTFTRVRSYGTCGTGPCRFEVVDKTANIVSLGETNVVATYNDNVTLRSWSLKQMQDPNGNYYDVTHVLSGNQLFPSSIQYTKHNAAPSLKLRRVGFEYENRPDPEFAYIVGKKVTTSQRLAAIKTYVTTAQGEELVRQYRMAYIPSGLTKRSLLDTVTECDALGICLPATEFDYNSNGAGTQKFAMSEPNGAAPYDYQHRMRYDPGAFLVMGDVSGDGRTDFLRFEKAGWDDDFYQNFQNYTSNGNGTFTANEYSGPDFTTMMNGDNMEIYPIDYNGDGRTDFIRREKGDLDNDAVKTFGVYVSKATGGFDVFFPGTPNNWNDPYQGLMGGDGGCILTTGDFNGDGRGDFLRQQRDRWADDLPQLMLNVYMSTGVNGEFNIVTPQGSLYAAMNGKNVDIIPGDFNGDGKTDFLRREKGEGNQDFIHSFDVFYSQGDGTFAIHTPGQPVQFDIYQDLLRSNLWWMPPGSSTVLPGTVRIVPGDFNGDGKTDFIRQAAGAWSLADPANTFSVYFSTGVNGTFEKVTPTGPEYYGEAFNGTSVEIIPLDYNGDGKTDFIRREFGSRADDAIGTFGLYVSRGDGTFDVTYPGTNGDPGDIYQGSTSANQALVHVGDIDGDGKSDFIRQEMGTAGADDIGTFQVFLANGDDAGDYLKKVTTGISSSVDVEYGRLNDSTVHTPSNPAVSPPTVTSAVNSMYVVKKTTVSEPNAAAETYQYKYTGGLMNSTGRGFLGFSRVEETGPLAIRRTDYLQTFPEMGSIWRTELVPVNDPAGKIVTTTRNNYSVQTEPGVFAVFVADESMTHQEGGGTFTTKKQYSYDAYGNATIVTDLGRLDTPTDDVQTCNAWANDTATWRIAYPTQTRIGESCQYSNGSCSCATTLKYVDRYYGSGTTITAVWELELALYTWYPTTYTYDVHGNMLLKRSPGLMPVGTGYGEYIDEITTYDPDYRTFPIAQSRVSAPEGLTTTFTYDPRFGALAAQTDPNGNTVTNQFDGLGRLAVTSATSPTGIVTPVSRITWGADAKGTYRQTSQRNSWTLDDWRWDRDYVDGKGHSYRTESQSSVNGSPVIVNRRFDSFGEIASETVPFYDDNNSWTLEPTTGMTYTRDWLGRISQIVDPVGNTTNVSYAVVPSPLNLSVITETTVKGTNPTAPTSLRTLDADGNVIIQVDADQHGTTFTYDKLGRRTSVQDGVLTTTQTYDSFGRVFSTTSSDRGTTSNSYSYRTGWLISSTDANGQVINFNYDTLGRLTSKVIAGKRTIYYGYDDPAQSNGLGRMTSASVVPVGQTNPTSVDTFGYTPDGRISSHVMTIGGTTYQVSSSYDPQGRLQSFTYPDGSVLDRTYDPQGLLSKLSIGGTEYARYENHTASGHPGKVTFANGTVRDHTYDAAMRASTSKTTKGTTTLLDYSYTWDAWHAITRIQDNRDATRTQDFTYSKAGRLKTASGIYPDEAYNYGFGGNLLSKGIDNTVTSFTYSGHRVVSGSNGFTATYDATGNRTGQTRDNVAWTYEYDGEDHLKRVLRAGTEVDSFDYNALGERIKKVETVGNNVKTTYYITPNYEVTVLPDNRQVRTKYINDAAGRVASIVTEVGSQAILMFDLQTLDRIKDSYNTRSLAGMRAYVQNRLQALWLRPWAHSLAKALLTFALLLTVGALLRKVLPGRIERIRDKLRSWLNPPATQYARRHPIFALATPLVMASFLAACQPTSHENVGYAEQELVEGTNGWGVPVAGTYFFHNNHLASSSVVTNLQGVEVARAEYTPFGEIVDNNTASPGSDMFRSKFTGKEWDREAKLYDFHARPYDPFTGQFLTPDSQLFGGPESAPTSLNPYAYANNNPIVYSDPSGNEFVLAVVIIVSICVGAYAGGMSANGTWNPAAWNWNSWTTYVGIAAGAAIGGVTAGAGSALGNGVAAGVLAATADSIVLNGLQFLAPQGYSLQDFGTDTAIGIVSGAVMAKGKSVVKKAAPSLWNRLTHKAALTAQQQAAKAAAAAAKAANPTLASRAWEASKAIGKGVWKVGTRIGKDEARTNLYNPGATDGTTPRTYQGPPTERADGHEPTDMTLSMIDALASSTGIDDLAGRSALDWRSSSSRRRARSACRAPEASGGFATAF